MHSFAYLLNLITTFMPGRKKKKHYFFEDCNDAWLILIGAFLIVIGLISFAQKNLADELSLAETTAIPKDPRAWIEIDFGNGKKREFEGDAVASPQTLFQSLSTISKDAKLSFTFRKNAIYEINGQRTSTGKWVIYKNGILTDLPLQELMVNRGDHYLIKYEH